MNGFEQFWAWYLTFCNSHVLCFDPGWMIWNLFLAFIGVIFGYLFWKSNNIFFIILFAVAWFFFIPNTIYIITDIKHLLRNLSSLDYLWEQTAYIFLYLLFLPCAFISYFMSMFFFHKAYQKHVEHIRIIKTIPYSVLILSLNTFFALGVAMGRIQRTNSWEVITNPFIVLQDALAILTIHSSFFYFGFFVIFINIIYFLGAKYIFKILHNRFTS